MRLLGVNISVSRLVAFAVALGVSLGVWWMLEKTRFGRAVRSVSQAPELAEISGISIEQVRNATFALGAAMAGLAGVLMAPTFASDPQLGVRFLIKAFAVIIVGGMGSYPGAIAAALLLGVIEVVRRLLHRRRDRLGAAVPADARGAAGAPARAAGRGGAHMSKPIALAVLLGLAAMAVPYFGTEYALSFTMQLLVFMILAYSWNLIGGYAGYTHFGQVCFFGLGGYVGALLIQKAGMAWYFAVPVAALAGIALALPLGTAMLRLKGPYFAIGMFGLTRVLESLVLGFDSVTQGGTGLYLVPLDNLRPVYYTLVGLALVMILATWRLDNSRLGLKLLAIREDEQAADALGVRTTRLKIGTFVVSAIAPAAVGALYAVYLGFIDPPTAFSPVMELTTIAIVLLGGMGTVLGPAGGRDRVVGRQRTAVGALPRVLPGDRRRHWCCWPCCTCRAASSNLGMKKGWLPAGRSLFRQLARESGRERSPAATPLVPDEAKRAEA